MSSYLGKPLTRAERKFLLCDPELRKLMTVECPPYKSQRRLSRSLARVKMDIDRKRPPSEKRIRQLLDRAGYTLMTLVKRRSPSGNGWHFILTVEPTPRTPFEVVALQSILGSDPFREAMNVLRARKLWNTPKFARAWWNVLYEPCKQRSRRVQLPRSRDDIPED